MRESKERFDSLFSSTPMQPGIGKFHEVNEKVYYAIVSPISGKEGVMGYVLRWRLQSASARSIEQFSNLIGKGSTLYVSNADGSLWSDLQFVIDHPKIDTGILHTPAVYTSKGGDIVMGSSKVIPGTPWQVTVEFSTSTLLAPAKQFLRWISIVGGIILVVGIFLAWIMSLNLTRPLNKLTSAASAIANGNYTPVSEVDRKDEVGKLARAFNAMSEQINKAKMGLENKVEETEVINNQRNA
jgi:HAMP domain-containing protein